MISIASLLIVADPDALGGVVADHLAGTVPLAGGLELYYALERSTSLLEFHTMLREGERNRTRDGLQQSYGDHNRLLMLALDRLLAGDVDWLRDHVAAGTAVREDSLRVTADTAGALTLAPDVQIALWLGAALHDCGMLCGQGSHVDVEDGVVLAEPLLERYCPPATRPVAAFALRNHDYIKDAFLGEAPVGSIAADLAAVDPDFRTEAMVALALIQVAGASSLGEGRLTDFRLDVFRDCVAGTALADSSNELRLARLLAPAPDTIGRGEAVPDVGTASDALAALDPESRADLDDLLERVFVHGWHDFTRNADHATRFVALGELAAHNRQWHADHLVIADPLRAEGDSRLPACPGAGVHDSLSGARTVAVLP
jgi:hypothetical protein